MSSFATIRLRDQAFGIDIHPTRQLLAAGLVTGQLKIYEWKPASEAAGEAGAAWQRSSARPHKTDACRVVRFSADGASIFTSGGDMTLQQRDLETNKPIWRRRDVHSAPVNALTRLSDVGVATGDDDGAVTCWDLRAHAAALKFHENSDYVADILYTEQLAKNRHTLAVAGGDGHLSVFDLRAGRLWARSDAMEDELLCLSLIKDGKKLLCGTQLGVVGIFSWGDFGDVSDRLLGHPSSVDCMLPCGEDAILTGSSDGIVRLVSVHPNKVVGVVAEHDDEAGIESLAVDATGHTLATCAHDQTIRLWDVAYVHEEDEGSEDGGGDDGDDSDSDGSDTMACSTRSNGRGSGASHALTDSEGRGRARKQPKQIVAKNASIKIGAEFFADL